MKIVSNNGDVARIEGEDGPAAIYRDASLRMQVPPWSAGLCTKEEFLRDFPVGKEVR